MIYTSCFLWQYQHLFWRQHYPVERLQSISGSFGFHWNALEVLQRHRFILSPSRDTGRFSLIMNAKWFVPCWVYQVYSQSNVIWLPSISLIMMFFKADDLVITGIHERSIVDENSQVTLPGRLGFGKALEALLLKQKPLICKRKKEISTSTKCRSKS